MAFAYLRAVYEDPGLSGVCNEALNCWGQVRTHSRHARPLARRIDFSRCSSVPVWRTCNISQNRLGKRMEQFGPSGSIAIVRFIRLLKQTAEGGVRLSLA